MKSRSLPFTFLAWVPVAAAVVMGCAGGSGGGGSGGGAGDLTIGDGGDGGGPPDVGDGEPDPTMAPAEPIILPDDPDEADPPTTARGGDTLAFESTTMGEVSEPLVRLGDETVPAEVVSDEGEAVQLLFQLPADLEPGIYEVTAVDGATGQVLAQSVVSIPRTLTAAGDLEAEQGGTLFIAAEVDPDWPTTDGPQFTVTVGDQAVIPTVRGDGILFQIPEDAEPGKTVVVVTDRSIDETVLNSIVVVMVADR